MPADRNHDVDDVTGRRHIISPRDPHSGLPTGRGDSDAPTVRDLDVRAGVWDDTDIVHVVEDSPHLIDTSTGEVVWSDEVRSQTIEVENDETHVADDSDGPRHVRGVVQKRLPGADDGASAGVAADVTHVGYREGGVNDTTFAADGDGDEFDSIVGRRGARHDNGTGDGAGGQADVAGGAGQVDQAHDRYANQEVSYVVSGFDESAVVPDAAPISWSVADDVSPADGGPFGSGGYVPDAARVDPADADPDHGSDSGLDLLDL